MVAKDVNADQLIHATKSLNQDYLIEVNLFDVYEGEHIEKGKVQPFEEFSDEGLNLDKINLEQNVSVIFPFSFVDV